MGNIFSSSTNASSVSVPTSNTNVKSTAVRSFTNTPITPSKPTLFSQTSLFGNSSNSLNFSNPSYSADVPARNTPQPPVATGPVYSKNIMALWNKFKTVREDEEVIDAEGIERLCQDLQIAPEHVSVLIFCWKINAKTMGYFSKEEFCGGLQMLGVESIVALRNLMKNDFMRQLQSDETLKQIYVYAFSFFLEDPEHNKCLDKETAIDTIQLLLESRFPDFSRKFVAFLNTQANLAGLSKDQWTQFFVFCQTTSTDLSNYADHFPTMIDEFVDWMNGKKPQEEEEEEDDEE